MHLDKSLDAPVISFFHAVREIAGRQFADSSVVQYALTADALSAAGFIGTVAVFQIFCFRTLGHSFFLSLDQILFITNIVLTEMMKDA